MMKRRRPSIVCSMFCLLVITPLAASALDAPTFSGPKESEAKYRTDWYACYRDAEKTVPPSVQATGEQGVMVVAVAVAARNKSVADLTVACMRSLGYVPEPAPTTGGKTGGK
jgi:hypothetical protein